MLNDLVQRLGDNGLNTDQLETLPLRGLSRMAIQWSCPLDATPPSDLFDLFDPADAEQALGTAAEVLNILESLDQQDCSDQPPNWSDWTP